MKLLVVLDKADPCEVGLLQYLHDRGTEVHLLANPNEPALHSLASHGLRTAALEIRHRFDLQAVGELRTQLDKQHFDFAFCATSRGITALISADKKSKFRGQTAFITYRGTMGHLSRFSLLSRRAQLHPRVDAILCNCDAVRKYMLTLGLPPEKLVTIYKGHDPAWYNSQPESQEWQARDKQYIACIANIRKCKGVDVLIKSYASVRDRLANIKLCIAGTVSDKSIPTLIKKLNLQNSVELLGFRTDTQQIIKHALFTVNPSTSREGVPRAMIESMCHSVPAIGTEIGGMPEILQHNITGIIVPPSNSQALAQAMLELGQNKEKREVFGRQARQFVLQELSVAGFGKKFEELMQTAMEQRKLALSGRR